ncbi:UDP-glucose/GDP-mannose dehydrogenase family protein [Nitratireductor sp. ZSWI3]|uniref:UDP-glucose dehydrogenase family protein n=1 Tax=Nitratireductor sp. ZSWI3 TaxID=2966359 RepID=UPI00214FB6DF|nr:UDP-glucose/GDP-mannose dehydrogenase family protein [Nitratireductor sp. ZSWI3]MCR4267843.1 UDP-glucose/GDP-mannose dehydrogenase family protein [Nitratireductor sp. ZSWI3]
MKIAVIGTGYVGLVSGACFAEWGHQVTCIDKDMAKIGRLQEGVVPIYEPGLEALVSRNMEMGRLSFSTEPSAAVEQAELVFLAVGTPPRAGYGDADLSYVFQAADEVSHALKDGAVLVLKSTVPVGTADAVERLVGRKRSPGSFFVVSNPEFLREGSAINDFLRPDRVIVGTEEEEAQAPMLALYRRLAEAEVPVLVTKRRSAELIKYASNAFLATKITFINELADLCEQLGIDVNELSLGVGLDHRIGNSFLNAGPGYGGSCFPKDTLALLRTAQDFGVALRIVEETVVANEARKRKMALKVIDAVGGDVEGMTIAVLGLTFKPDTDDMRDAPSVPLIETLQRFGAHIRAYDPAGMPNAARLLDRVEFATDAYECARKADAAVVVTEWDVFRRIDLARLRQTMRSAHLVDLRNLFPRTVAEAAGFLFTSIGRPVALQSAIPATQAVPTRARQVRLSRLGRAFSRQ